MKRICRYLTNTLSLSENAYELMYYGMFVVVTNLLSILSILIIGYLFDELKNTIVFMISFIPLRLYIGGYHASSPAKCYLYFNIISTIFILLFKININIEFLFVITFILLCMVLHKLIVNKQENKIKIVVIIYFVLIFIVHLSSYYSSFLLGIIMAIGLYEIKFITKNV